MEFSTKLKQKNYTFKTLKELLAKATPLRSGDQFAGVAAASAEERVAAQIAISNVTLKCFLEELLVPYETDEVTRLIIDKFDYQAFSSISNLTIGEFRNWLLSEKTTSKNIADIKWGLTPEMVAATSKIMRNQDLMTVSKKCKVVTQFRTTIGLDGRFSTRLQPNHPTDDLKGIPASTLDGLLFGCGDAVIGINPATDSIQNGIQILEMLNNIRERLGIPTQTCVLSHVTNTIKMIERKAPVDLIFQSIGGTESLNSSFGINLSILEEAYQAGKSLHKDKIGNNFMYFETGQGAALSANAHHGMDQQTCEARAYAVARIFDPFLVNTVVGFIGPEYLFDGKQITRAGLEDHFCGKLLGLPMGCDICYTNHAEADQDDMDNLLTLLGVAGCSFIMGVPGADDIMLNYQSTSYHDALYIRNILGLKPAPEFEKWLEKMGIFSNNKLQTTSISDKILKSIEI